MGKDNPASVYMETPFDGQMQFNRKTDKCNPIQRLFFYWVDPLIRQGYHTRLEPQDMLVNNSVQTDELHSKFDEQWQKQLQKPEPDIKRAVIAGNSKMLVFTGILYMIAQACTLAGPLLLNRIVSGLSCIAAQQNNPAVVCEGRGVLY